MKKLNARVQQILDANGLPNPWAVASDPELALHWDHLEFDPHGWFCDENRETLEILIRKHRVASAIELGCWLGKSTRFFADRCELVIAIDHWKGSPEHHLPGRDDVAEKLPRLYPQFLRNCSSYENICPLRVTTATAKSLVLPKVGLIYVDAAHDEGSVFHDIYAFLPMLGPGGVMCGDDWRLESVQDAVRLNAKGAGKAVMARGNFWWLEDSPLADSAHWAPSIECGGR